MSWRLSDAATLMRRIVLLCGILLSTALIWFTLSNYQSARPVAEENLRGLALSLTSAIENIALHDPSLKNLETFQSHDIAFFALVDQNGLYRFHTNPDLINTPVQNAVPSPALLGAGIGYQVAENFRPILLIKGTTPPADGTSNLLEVRLRLKYQATNHTGIEGYVAKGITTNSPDYGTGLSVSYDF